MIDRNYIRTGLAVVLALVVPGAQAATTLEAAGSKALCSVAVDVGAQKVEVRGSNEKFTEYRDLRDGALLDTLMLSISGTEKPFFFEFEARNAVRGFLTPDSRDAYYRMSAGRYGKYRFTGTVDRTPHNFAQGKLILSGAGTGNLGIANSVQTLLQANEQTRAERGGVSLTDTTGEDATQQNIIRGLLDAAGPTSFQLDREKGTLAGELSLSRDAKTWVKFSEERRKGFRQIGMGSYERYVQPVGTADNINHLADQFVAEGIEIAEPIDYKTQSVNAGVGLYKKDWSADLEYTFTKFTERIASLVWANPFRTTDATARNATDTAGNNAFDRARFVRGQASLPPTSQSHEVAASGSVELPLHSRLTGAVGLGLTQQNNALLPYTLNTAISGVGGAPNNITDPSTLPVGRFNGETRNLTGSFQFTSRPVEALRTALKYRYYDYANRSDTILFPGYAAFGESYWRTTRNDAGTPVSNELGAYTRQTTEVSADLEISEPLSVDAKAFWDQWDYRNMRVNKTSELGAGAGFAYHVGHAAKVHGGLGFARRVTKDYRAGASKSNPEAVDLANYNWADRQRKKANLGVGVTPTETLSFGLDGSYQEDKLGADQRFGLKEVATTIVALDAGYEPSERFSLSFDASREVRRSKIQNGAKDGKYDSASAIDDGHAWDNFNPLSYWNDTITETVDTIGIEATVRPQEKLECTAGYAFSLSDMAFDVTNPNGAEAAAAGFGNGSKLANGAAQSWPSVVGKLHEVRVGAGYQLLKDLKIGGNYLFSKYSLNDFSNTGSYLPGTSPENTTKYVFTGATNHGYEAHVIGTYVAWKF